MAKSAQKEKAYHWIDRDDDFEDCLVELLDAEALAIDTEGDNYYTYTPSICLIQIATGSSIYLLDTIALSKESICLMAPILEDPLVPKIFHGADNDLAYLYMQYGIRVGGLFDTILAARFLNLPKRGLGDLLDLYFQVQSSKRFQRYDWRIRPLDPEALRYAVQDAEYLLQLSDLLKAELKEQGRLDAVMQESEQLTLRKVEAKPFDPHGYRRIKGSKDLTIQQLGVLYALYTWRHKRCLKLNKAAFLFLDNPTLLELSQKQPRSSHELRRINKLSPRQARLFGSDLLDVIEEGRKQRAPARPRNPHKRRSSLSPHEQEKQAELYDQLRSWRQKVSKSAQFELDLVATNHTLQTISKDKPTTIEEIRTIPGMLPWRCKLFAPDMLKIVQRA